MGMGGRPGTQATVRGAMGHKNINSTVASLSFVEDEIDQTILAS
jgi:hypothetical protein